MDAEIRNPLLRGADRKAASDDDDGIDYFGSAAPRRVPTPPSPVHRRPQPVSAASAGPIELGDSDDDDEIQATFVSGPAAPTGATGPSRASSRATASHTRSPSATAGPSKTHRNPLMYGAPDEVRISLVVRSHLDPAKAKKSAIDYLERPMVFKVNRVRPRSAGCHSTFDADHRFEPAVGADQNAHPGGRESKGVRGWLARRHQGRRPRLCVNQSGDARLL